MTLRGKIAKSSATNCFAIFKLPSSPGRPYRRGIRPHHGRPETPHASIHIRMRVGRNGQRLRERIPLLDHNLVANASSRGIEIDTVEGGELLYGFVFFEINGGFVLDVVVEGEDGLGRVEEFRGDGGEFRHDGGGVVVRHDAVRGDGDEGALADVGVLCVALHDLLHERLGVAGVVPGESGPCGA